MLDLFGERTVDLGDGVGIEQGVGVFAASRVVYVSCEEDHNEVRRRMEDVAAQLGASAGATRVATDAGWAAYSRQRW